MVAEFSIIPLGSGVHMSSRLAKVMRLIDASGLDYRVGSMGTTVEGSWDLVMRLIQRCHHLMLTESGRVLTSITIDDRKGATHRLTGKVVSVMRKVGKPLKT
jgi:uncharacterized protein (TIGR00106 family)